MPATSAIATVDRLHALEATSLLQQLGDSTAYVPATQAALALTLRDLQIEEQQNARELAEVLDDLGATPGPRLVRHAAAEINYTRLEALIPRLVADQQRLLAACTAAAADLGDEPLAAGVVSRVAARHRDHLARLQELAGSPTAR